LEVRVANNIDASKSGAKLQSWTTPHPQGLKRCSTLKTKLKIIDEAGAQRLIHPGETENRINEQIYDFGQNKMDERAAR